MAFGKIVEGRLYRLGERVLVDGVMVDSASDEAAQFRADGGWLPIDETPPAVALGFVACVSGVAEVNGSIVVSFVSKPLADASPLDISRSLNWQTIAAMTDREKTAVMQKMAKFINERAY